MKKIIFPLFLLITLLSFSVEKKIPYDKFEELNFEKTNYIIQSITDDIDNDGLTENIMLIGELSSNTPFIQNVKLVISNNRDMFILYKNAIQDGYEPNLFLGDFTGDGNKDILIRCNSGGSGGYIYVNLLSFNGTYIKELFNSKNQYYEVKGNFKENFKANISMKGYFSYDVNLDYKKAQYLKEDFYSEDGKIKVDDTRLIIGGISQFEPQKWKDKYVIRYLKSVSGFYHADSLGYVELILDFSKEKPEVVTASFSVILY